MTTYAKYLLISTIFRTCANQFYFCYFDIIVNAVITREIAAALDRTNLSDRKSAHFICKTFQTGCRRTYNKCKCYKTSSNEAFAADCGKIMENTQVLEESEWIAYTHFGLWTKRCKTVICAKTP